MVENGKSVRVNQSRWFGTVILIINLVRWGKSENFRQPGYNATAATAALASSAVAVALLPGDSTVSVVVWIFDSFGMTHLRLSR